jgi:hypothetical protein
LKLLVALKAKAFMPVAIGATKDEDLFRNNDRPDDRPGDREAEIGTGQI